jgi:hypothetical protein
MERKSRKKEMSPDEETEMQLMLLGSMAPPLVMPFIYPGMLPWLKNQKKPDDNKKDYP